MATPQRAPMNPNWQYMAQLQNMDNQMRYRPQPPMQGHQRPQQRAPPPKQQQQQPQQQQANRDYARQQELAASSHAAESERRRVKNPTMKNIPPGVEDLIVGDGVEQYARLREVERRMDAIMMRKRLDMQDPLVNRINKFSSLKIWLSNTVENQPWQGSNLDENAFDFNMGVEATYKVKIEGRIVDDDNGEEAISSAEKAGDENGDSMEVDGNPPTMGDESPSTETLTKNRFKLSHFFKAIIIDFDRNRNLQPEGMTQIKWKKPKSAQNTRYIGTTALPAEADFDCLEFERKSDENINCTIYLYRDEDPERFKLDKPLSELLDTEEETRAGIVLGIWEYVKAMGLHSDEEEYLINCDDLLRAVFESDTVHIPELQRLIEKHLSPLPPIALPYTIRVDPEFHASPSPTVYVLNLRTPPAPVQAPKTAQARPSSSSPATAAAAAITSTAADPSSSSLAKPTEDNTTTSNPAAANPEPTTNPPPKTTTTPPTSDPDPPRTLWEALTDKSTINKLRSTDDHIALLIQAMTATKTKRDFLHSMAVDPVGFTNRWMKSQRKDLETILGEDGRFESQYSGAQGLRGEWTRGAGGRGGGNSVWSGKEVEEAVAIMVGRKGSDGRTF